jgi:hypothetical protein
MSDDWKLPWMGGCLCGNVRFHIHSPPLLTMVCHCTWCQKRSASAFSSIITVPSIGFEITSGEPEISWSASEHSHYFCPRCKNWMFLRIAGADLVNLRATMLDDHCWFAPYVEIFAGNKAPWVSTAAPHSFADMPGDEDFEALITSFADNGPRPNTGNEEEVANLA